MPDIVLYQFPGDVGVESASPFCAKVHRVLGYKGLEYKRKNVASPKELERINPGVKKVPVISYDGELVPDSKRIVRFLEERHPTPSLLPTDPSDAAMVHLLQTWADDSLYWIAVYQRWAVDSNFEPFSGRAFSRLPIPIRWIVPPLARRTALKQLHGQGLGRAEDGQVLELLKGHLTMLAGLLDGRLYLATDELTVADIAVFAPLKALAASSSPQTVPLIRASEPVWKWMLRMDEATTSEHTVALATKETV